MSLYSTVSQPESHKKNLPFSREPHASVLESSIIDNGEPCSSSNATLKPEEVLRLLQDIALPCFKYCLTMRDR